METITPTYSGVAGKILEMLGNGLSPEVVSSVLGVSPSYISQLVSDEHFAAQVSALRFSSLQTATALDRKYDGIEDKLATKLEDAIPMMFKSSEILKAVGIVNSLKRRGANNVATNTTINQTVVQLVLPTALTSKFTLNSTNQVISTGDQELITIGAAELANRFTPKSLGVTDDTT